jgi:hypothetical protein
MTEPFHLPESEFLRLFVRHEEALPDEFEKSGASGAKFARLAGIK